MPRKVTPASRRTGSRLKALRDERRFSLRALAERSGIPRSKLSRLELGKQEWTVEDAKAVAEGLAVTVNEVIGDAA